MSAAEWVLKTYRASLAYAGLTDSDTVAAPTVDKTNDDAILVSPPVSIKVKVGDLVKWTSNGVDQFDARKVEWIAEDGSHLRVIGSKTGIPMNEVEKVGTQPAPQPAASATVATAPQADPPGKAGKLMNVSTSVIGNRLQISADVDSTEIDDLLAMLKKYQEILKLMN